MQFLRRKSLRRIAVAGTILVGGTLAALLWPDAQATYVSGEADADILDTLGREVPADHPAIAFTDVAAEAGLAFRHFPGRRSGHLPEDMGSGVALGDADGDGWTDVFACNLAGPLAAPAGAAENGGDGACRFFRNRGDGSFEDLTEEAGLGLRALANAAAWVDVDGDGDLDLFVTAYGRCRLFRNEGGLRFADASTAAGLDAFEGFWAGIAVADYDCDGDLDLYVCGYVRYRADAGAPGEARMQYGTAIPARLNPSVFEPERNLLLRNRGDGTFEEVAAAAGVAGERGRSLGAVWADFDRNGWPDLYVANDVSDNALYLNRGDGGFDDRTAEALVGDYRGAMGMAAGDFDQDLDLDLVITHWVAQENALYVNVGGEMAGGGAPRLLFMDEADRRGLGQIALEMVGWATGFLDFDNDGLRDLFVVNGSTIPSATDPSQLVAQRSQLFWNAGGKRGFFELGGGAAEFFRRRHVGRGGACFDYDLDGDPDLLVLAHGDGLHLLRNERGQERGAVLLRLRQPAGDRFAVGAEVVARWGDHAVLDAPGAQGSYLSQHAVGEIAYGLGDATALDAVEVRWPDGVRESAGPFPAGSLVTWARGEEPRVEPLPGLAAPAADGSVSAQRRFYAVLRDATSARIAGRLAEAEPGYREALALRPGHADSLYYLGNLLREQGREAEALATLEELVREHPDGSRGWMQIGRLRLPGGDPALDDLAAARAAFTRCRELNREESEPALQLGIVVLLEGDLAAADVLFAEAEMHNLRSVAARWFRGLIAFRRGDRAAAERLLAAAHELAVAAAASAAATALHEGETRQGGAMTAVSAAAAPDALLERWRSLAAREVDVDAEFGGR